MMSVSALSPEPANRDMGAVLGVGRKLRRPCERLSPIADCLRWTIFVTLIPSSHRYNRLPLLRDSAVIELAQDAIPVRDLEGERRLELREQRPRPMRFVPIALQPSRKIALRLHALLAPFNVTVGKLKMLAGNFAFG